MQNRQSLWATRELASQDLNDALSAEADALEALFGIVDETVEDFQKFFVNDSEFARVAALVTVKGRTLALGCYSLALDGLGQEAGALLRPLLESIELLRYVRLVPEGPIQLIEGRLPAAGKRAKLVAGPFKTLREHLNQHACHVGFTYESLRHTIDLQTGRLKTFQPHSTPVLRQNMGSVCLFAIVLAQEAAACFAHCSDETGKASVTAESRVNKVYEFRNRVLPLFFPDETIAQLLNRPGSQSLDNRAGS